jgi:arylsulfatase A-like enzyme
VKQSIAVEAPRLASVLRHGGYRTLAAVGHTFVGRHYGFDVGFDKFDQSVVARRLEITSDALTEIALKLVASELREPFFLWVHYFDPHLPYTRAPEYGFADGYSGPIGDTFQFAGKLQLSSADLDYVRAIYAEEIRRTDTAIGRLVEQVEALPLRHPTTFFVTSDHGEFFMERGRIGHDEDVYQILIRVPLIIGGHLPGHLRGHRASLPVETRAIAKTIARMAGLGETAFGGADLFELAGAAGLRGRAYSEGSSGWTADDRKISVIGNSWKLIHNRRPDTWELYNLARDPDELDDHWSSSDGSVAEQSSLRSALIRFANELRPRHPPGRAVRITEKQRERLRALGYVE